MDFGQGLEKGEWVGVPLISQVLLALVLVIVEIHRLHERSHL